MRIHLNDKHWINKDIGQLVGAITTSERVILETEPISKNSKYRKIALRSIGYIISFSVMVAILSHYLPLNSVYPKVTSKYKKKYGLIDSSNKVILPLIYDEIKPFPNEQILTTVKKEGKYGVIAINGYEIVKPICDSIKIDFDKISGKYVITHDTSRTKSFTADQIIQLIKNNAQNFISGIDSLVDKPILNIQNPKFESE